MLRLLALAGLAAAAAGAGASLTWEERARAHAAARGPEALAELLEFVRIPSISAQPARAEDVRRAAEWSASKLRAMGLEHVSVLETGGHPVITADWLHAPGRPTVLCYGHFDTQPDGGEWTTPPFAAVLYEQPGEGQAVRGRGASDDKGALLGALEGLLAVAATSDPPGGFPVNVRVVLEGQEEIGSPQLESWMLANKEHLVADVAFSADGDQHSTTVPALTLSHRGAVALEMTVTTSSTDLHSGSYGGSVPNAAVVLSGLLAKLHDKKGAVAAPGFYEGVRKLSAAERAAIAAVPLNEAEDKAQAGVIGYVGEAGFSTLERRWVRPTAEVVGMWGGYTGDGIKTVLPAAAHAKIVARLVCNQVPDKAFDALAAFFRSQCPPYANLTIARSSFSAVPSESPADSAANAAAAELLTEMYGVPPLLKRSGGSIPFIGLIKKHFGLDTTTLAVTHPGNRVHAPDEYYAVRDLERGAQLWASILFRYAAKFKAENKQAPAGISNEL